MGQVPYRRQSNTPAWILVAVFVGIPLLCVLGCVGLFMAGFFAEVANSNAP